MASVSSILVIRGFCSSVISKGIPKSPTTRDQEKGRRLMQPQSWRDGWKSEIGGWKEATLVQVQRTAAKETAPRRRRRFERCSWSGEFGMRVTPATRKLRTARVQSSNGPAKQSEKSRTGWIPHSLQVIGVDLNRWTFVPPKSRTPSAGCNTKRGLLVTYRINSAADIVLGSFRGRTSRPDQNHQPGVLANR